MRLETFTSTHTKFVYKTQHNLLNNATLDHGASLLTENQIIELLCILAVNCVVDE